MWIIILLAFLILLVILAIIYRNKLRLWWFRFRGKASVRPTGPSPPPSIQRPMMRAVPRFGAVTPRPIRTAPPRPVTRPAPGDKEFEETMRKLREMSK